MTDTVMRVIGKVQVSTTDRMELPLPLTKAIRNGVFPLKFKLLIALTWAAYLVGTISGNILGAQWFSEIWTAEFLSVGTVFNLIMLMVGFGGTLWFLALGSEVQKVDKDRQNTKFARDVLGPWLLKQGVDGALSVAWFMLDGQRQHLTEKSNPWGAFDLQLTFEKNKPIMMIWKWKDQ